jgi:SRSO17 transposase
MGYLFRAICDTIISSEVTSLKYRFSKKPLEGLLSDFAEKVRLHKVDETILESYWNSLVRDYHYLGYDKSIGCRIKYLITLGDRLVGAISYCSGAYKLGLRDKFIGWDEATRLAFLPRLVCNNRFLIFPWVKVRNLASHVLAMSLKQLRIDWEKQYEIEPYMAETFVDSDKYRGTCYVADNWVRLGETKGFGKVGNTFVFHGNIKDIYVKIINRRFTKTFRPTLDRLPDEKKEILSHIVRYPFDFQGVLERFEISGYNPETIPSFLADHLARYTTYLTRIELNQHFVTMVKGFLSDLPRKTVGPICQAYALPKEERGMNNFMTRSGWDDQGLLFEYQNELNELLADPKGMIAADARYFRKQGTMSVGVVKQRFGPNGKFVNCQAGLSLGLAGQKNASLMDFEIFLPEKWFADDYAVRRENCNIPKDLTFKSKIDILSDRLNYIINSGLFIGQYISLDEEFGECQEFIDSLPNKIVYFIIVNPDRQVFLDRHDLDRPIKTGQELKKEAIDQLATPRAVKDIVADSSRPWKKVELSFGAYGPIKAQDKLIKVLESRDGVPGKSVWLYARRYEDGRLEYALCNKSMDSTLEDIREPALKRWSLEQSYNEGVKRLGLDQYEVRTWPGWRRHVLLVLVAHLFVVKLRMGQFNDKSDLKDVKNLNDKLQDACVGVEKVNR